MAFISCFSVDDHIWANDFLECFHSDSPNISLIQLLRVLWCPKHRRLFHRKFLSGRNTWKILEIWVFKSKPKSCMVAMATCMRADWWKWNFLNGKLPERSQSRNSKLQAILKIFYDVCKGAQSAPGLDRVKLNTLSQKGKILYTKRLLVNAQINIELHDISTRTTSKIKPDYLVCFAKVLQEFLLWSTYPSPEIKIKKEKWIIWLFFSFMVSSLPQKNKNFRFT